MHTRAKGNQGLLPYIPEINKATRRKNTQGSQMASSSAIRNPQGRGTNVPNPPPVPINPQAPINQEEPILEEPQANRANNQENNREEEYYGIPQEPQRSIADYMTPDFNMHNSIYVPPMRLRRLIQEFKQGMLESLGEAWRRFKVLKRQCPQDLMHPWDMISSFYGGLTDEGKCCLTHPPAVPLSPWPYKKLKN